jgi:hypothetical protein
METTSLFEQLVAVGPAADRFISRQIRNHLHIEPESLNKKDLRRLIDWLKLAMGLLTSEQKIVDEYVRQVRSLIRTPNNTTPKVRP